jgi:N-acetylneuraminic acid mutarotase
MKQKLTLVSILPIFLLVFSFQPINAVEASCQISLGTWTTAASAPYVHIEGATAVIDGKLYIFSGFKDSSLNVSNRVDVYNPATNKWETATNPLRPMPISLSHAQVAVDGKWVWMAGGFVGSNPGKATNKVYKYDSSTDQWYSGPSLPAARAGGTIAIVGRELHYIGGLSYNRDTDYANHWVLNLDATGQGWKSRAELPTKRNQAGGIAIGNFIYHAGGQFKHDHNPKDVNFVHAFNVTTGTWAQKASLPFGRSHNEPGTVNIEGRIVMVGGRANQIGKGQINNVTEYNPSKNQWRELRPLPVALIAPNAAYINGKLIVTMGGRKWNAGSKTTYISEVSFTNCG